MADISLYPIPAARTNHDAEAGARAIRLHARMPAVAAIALALLVLILLGIGQITGAMLVFAAFVLAAVAQLVALWAAGRATGTSAAILEERLVAAAALPGLAFASLGILSGPVLAPEAHGLVVAAGMAGALLMASLLVEMS